MFRRSHNLEDNGPAADSYSIRGESERFRPGG